jgi:AcrR family transcriptional regulator
MSPRTATLTDDEILVRATRVVRAHGPRVSLAKIAAHVGLTSARLVQRFGSRQQLLAAVEESVDARLLQHFVAGVAEHQSPRRGLVESLARLAERSAKRLYLLSNSYVFDPRHLAAPDGAQRAQERNAEFERALQSVVSRMTAAREFPQTDGAALAHAIYVCWVGSYNLWAYAPIGSVGDAVRKDLGFLLDNAAAAALHVPHRTTISRSQATARTR